MWRSIAPPIPRPRAASATCIDLTSPWFADNRFSAPKPKSVSLSQTAQKLMSGDRSPVRSRAWALPGAVSARALARWTRSRSTTRGSSRSPGTIRIGGLLPARPTALTAPDPLPIQPHGLGP